MIKEAISKVVQRVDLTREEMIATMNEIMSGEASSAQISSFITALRMKGESIEEITGAAIVMREKVARLSIDQRDTALIDTCGTGGSRIDSFNISTTVAFVVSGAGVKVAKHGNRGVSSGCGSADLMQALGIRIELPPEKVKACIEKIGIGFLFAPLFHPAMKFAIGPRREIGIRTIFNILGPLTSPAFASSQLMGVYEEGLVETLARVLNNLGTKRAFVVHGMDGLDEITITDRTKVSEVRDGKVFNFFLSPEDFGVKKGSLEDIKSGKSIEENVGIVLNILKGEKGPRRNIVLMNASCALVAAGVAKDYKSGVKLASDSIDSKKAFEKIEALKRFSNE